MSCRLVIEGRVSFYFACPPPKPGPLITSFIMKGDQMTGFVAFKDPSTDTTVTSRPVGVVINGGAENILDCFAGEQSYQCNAGDAVVLTPKGDINPVGPGSPGTPLSLTAAVEPTTGVPPIPGELMTRFTEP